MYGTCKYVKCIPSFFGASMRGIGFTSAGFTLTIFLTPPPPPPPPGTREEEEEEEEEAGGPMLLMAFWSSLVVPPVDGFGLHAFSTHTYVQSEVEITAGHWTFSDHFLGNLTLTTSRKGVNNNMPKCFSCPGDCKELSKRPGEAHTTRTKPWPTRLPTSDNN